MIKLNLNLKRLRPDADIRTTIAILFSAMIVGIYLNYHVIYIIPIFLIIYGLIISTVLFKKWNKTAITA